MSSDQIARTDIQDSPNLNPILWMVAWTGGDDEPSFQSFTTEPLARDTYNTWVAQANDRHDRITLVEQVITDAGVINLKIDEHCPAWQENPDED